MASEVKMDAATKAASKVTADVVETRGAFGGERISCEEARRRYYNLTRQYGWKLEVPKDPFKIKYAKILLATNFRYFWHFLHNSFSSLTPKRKVH